MYELLIGRHPFWKKGMNKEEFKDKIEALKFKNDWSFPREKCSESA
jgi:hypothetical protein